jgi:hypothetical protein
MVFVPGGMLSGRAAASREVVPDHMATASRQVPGGNLYLFAKVIANSSGRLSLLYDNLRQIVRGKEAYFS